MKQFRAVFQIVEDNNCPLYELDDLFALTEKSVSFPEEKESCLILVRELTQLLFQLIGKPDDPDFIKKYDCSGCTGLIKFRQVLDDGSAGGGDGESLLSDKEQKLFDKIREYTLLKAIPANHLKKFIGCFKGKIIAKDECLISKGHLNEYLYLIISGEVVVEDGSVPITRLREGDLCGEMSYLGEGIASTSVRGNKETKVLAIHGKDFSKLIKKSDSVQMHMAKLLAKRLSRANTVRASEFESCMHGRINEMAPAELLQVFHMHQKTGMLTLELPQGDAKIGFSEGAIVLAEYGGNNGQAAVFSILRERDGVYNFISGLTDEDRARDIIGDFMMLLMEGVRQVDED